MKYNKNENSKTCKKTTFTKIIVKKRIDLCLNDEQENSDFQYKTIIKKDKFSESSFSHELEMVKKMIPK